MVGPSSGLTINVIKQIIDMPLNTKDARRILDEFLPFVRAYSKGIKSSATSAHKIIQEYVVNGCGRELDMIDKALLLLAYSTSNLHIPGYSTLDSQHIHSINGFLESIKTYANDSSQKRPLVFLMLASPGAGKSHFIKCIANQLATVKVRAITYNMSGQQSNEDLIPPLDAARNLKVSDHIPLLFLDEFDSSPDFIPTLLPLLWDGELTIGPRDLKLGKVVIVLAGSNPAIQATMEDASSMKRDTQLAQDHSQKLIDLLSRINGGVIRIPSFNDMPNLIDRRVDKVCIVIELLRQRFGDQLGDVPLSLLRFIAQADFRYGVRSIAHLVSTIPYKDKIRSLKRSDLHLPFDDAELLKSSSLAYHLLNPDQALGVEKLWKTCLPKDSQVPIHNEWISYLQMRGISENDFSFYGIRQYFNSLNPRRAVNIQPAPMIRKIVNKKLKRKKSR